MILKLLFSFGLGASKRLFGIPRLLLVAKVYKKVFDCKIFSTGLTLCCFFSLRKIFFKDVHETSLSDLYVPSLFIITYFFTIEIFAEVSMW